MPTFRLNSEATAAEDKPQLVKTVALYLKQQGLVDDISELEDQDDDDDDEDDEAQSAKTGDKRKRHLSGCRSVAPRPPENPQGPVKRPRIQQPSSSSSAAAAVEHWDDELPGDPLEKVSVGLKRNYSWYRAKSVPPFTFAADLKSKKLHSMLSRASSADGGSNNNNNGNISLPADWSFTLGPKGSQESSVYIYLTFPERVPVFHGQAIAFHRTDQRETDDPEECTSLLDLYNFMTYRSAHHGESGVHIAARLFLVPHPHNKMTVTVQAQLHTYVSSFFLGLDDLPPQYKLVQPSLRITAYKRILPTSVKPRLAELAARHGSDFAAARTVSSEWFYACMDAAPVPRVDDPKGKGKARDEPVIIKPPGLKPALMPFQSRSVAWLLSREGMQVDWASAKEAEDGVHSVKPLPEEEVLDIYTLPYWDHKRLDPSVFKPIKQTKKPEKESMDMSRYLVKESDDEPSSSEDDTEMDGKDGTRLSTWVNYLTGQAMAHRPLADNDGGGFGVLCEEMGLGKTVEILSLILMRALLRLHPLVLAGS